MKILIIGLTSGRLGGMEYANLGNYVIMEPFVEKLHEAFPDAKIATSIQMSDLFCKRFNIKSLRDERFWRYGKYTAFCTIKDFIKSMLWWLFKRMGFNFKFLLKKSLLLNQIEDADLIIDFSGDVYGDNAVWYRFLEANAELLFCKVLGKKTVMLIGSPGPFKKKWRQWVARKILAKLDLITNREALSTIMLESIGIKGNNIITTACPSIFFKKDTSQEMSKIIKQEKIILQGKSTIGLILCGWNMPRGPFNKWPRENSEYENFVSLLRHLIFKMNLRVCLMSHQNGVSKNLKLIKGNDHQIIKQLMTLMSDCSMEQLFTLKGLYNAAQSKAIIGNFEMLISGRIHGAVQGLSQAIPTAIIDYGHEPKAHKLKGFASIYGIEQYICDPASKSNLIQVSESLWTSRETVREQLVQRLPYVEKLADQNFSILHRVVNRND